MIAVLSLVAVNIELGRMMADLRTTKSRCLSCKHMRRLVRKTTRRSGQSLVEYTLILALVSVLSIAVLRGIGQSVNNKLASINANLQ